MLVQDLRTLEDFRHLRLGYLQGGHKPGKLREFGKIVKISEKIREFDFFCGKTWKTQGKCKISDMLPMKMCSSEFLAPELLRKI